MHKRDGHCGPLCLHVQLEARCGKYAVIFCFKSAKLTTNMAVLQVLEQHTKVGSSLSAPLLSLMLALVLSASGVIPVSSTTYDIIWTYLMPLGAALYLLESDLRQ